MSGGKTSKRTKKLRIISDPIFATKGLSTDLLLEKIRDGSLYGYIQCDLVVPDELNTKFANFLQFSKTLKEEEMILGNICKIKPLKMSS